ncbi:MAG: Xaa-Pro peptidase family protein [bacterium]|nr:Xaa-Pro peptidase family protein [bacterium]
MIGRIKKIQDFLYDKKLEAFLVLTRINRQYLSGFTGSSGVVVIWKNRAELFVDDRYTIRAKKESDLAVQNLKELPFTLNPSPRGRGAGVRIGIEDRITLREAALLERDHPAAKWVPTRDIVENLRAVKSAEELKNIKKGSAIIDATFRHIVRTLKTPPLIPPLMRGGRGRGRERKIFTETDIAQEIERFGKKLGADALAFDSIVAFGENAAAPHHFSSNQKIRKGNFLLLDFGFLVKGYHSDFTRTLFVGSPSKKQEKVYNTVLGAQMRAIEAIKPGVKASQIDAVARRFIGQSGFGKYFTHNTGHGVGLEIHELPNFSTKSEDGLDKNMIVTVEPGIYIEKWGGVRIEDMVVVVKDKTVVLSEISKNFKAMIIH